MCFENKSCCPWGLLINLFYSCGVLKPTRLIEHTKKVWPLDIRSFKFVSAFSTLAATAAAMPAEFMV